MGGIWKNADLILLSLLAVYLLQSFVNAANPGCSTMMAPYCECLSGTSCLSGCTCTDISSPDPGYSLCPAAPACDWYQSSPNQCGYSTSANYAVCSAAYTSCSPDTYYPTLTPLPCAQSPTNRACIPASTSGSCDICGNCTSGTCNAALCGATYGCGGGKVCNGSIGSAGCVAPAGIGSPCKCNATCSSGNCVVNICAASLTTTKLIQNEFEASGIYGTDNVLFCYYQDAATGNSITPAMGAIVNITINNVVYTTTYSVGFSAYEFRTIPLPVGTYTWFCNASAPGYESQNGSASPQTYTVTPIPTTLTQSAIPPISSPPGTSVTFMCDYSNQSDSVPVTGATVYVNINGTNYAAPYNPATGNYTYPTPPLALGSYVWYCNASAANYQNQTIAPPDTYNITQGEFCNIAWTLTPDFKTTPDNHYAHLVNQPVTVAVLVTDASGIPVGNQAINITAGGLTGSPLHTVTTDAAGIATTTFSLNTTAGSYPDLNATAPQCSNGVGTQNNLSSYINAFHDAPKHIAVTDPSGPSPKIINVGLGQSYNISIEIQDQYGNICNGSFDGTPYLSSPGPYPGPYDKTIAITQTLMNSTDTWNYDPAECTVYQYEGPPPISPCYAIFNNSGGGTDGKYTFNLLAYPFLNYTLDNITHDFSEDTLTYDPVDFLSSTFTPNGGLTADQVIVNITYPPPPPPTLRITLTPPEIRVNDSFNITITAVYANGTINTNLNDYVDVLRLARPDAPLITQAEINTTPIQLTSGTVTFNVPVAQSFSLFYLTGVYRIYAYDTNPATEINGSASLLVGNSGVDHINVTVTPQGVFRTLPFYAIATIKDGGDNVIKNFTGIVNITCPDQTTDPPSESVPITPLNEGQVNFTFIANQSGTILCNVSAYDSIKGTSITDSFSVLVVEPAMCTAYDMPPIATMNPPFDVKVPGSDTPIPPVATVMQHNDMIGPLLVGYDPISKTMKGNFSICLESYHSGRMCVNSTDVQFDTAPISVCVKEFVYNPEADGYISDHLNYNGTGNLIDTFKHPEVVWGWGYNASSATLSNCSMTPAGPPGPDKYSVVLIPGDVYPDYFNMTVTLPLGPLQPYNITNDTPLNPHELIAPSALLVLDERNNGRLAKFNLSSSSTLVEEYVSNITGAGAQSIAYDNRGNIFVTLTKTSKLLELRVIRAAPPTISYVRSIDVVTQNGTIFQPYGIDTDTWGNIYIVGNTDPDQPDNYMCINKYNNSLDLLDSNNCSEAYEGTVPSIAISEDGGTIYIVKDKRRMCGSVGNCYWTGDSHIYEYNGSNFDQNIENISIFGQDGGSTLFGANPDEKELDGACWNDAGKSVIMDNTTDYDEAHYLRGIKEKRGYLFVIDYMAFPHRAYHQGACYPCGGWNIACCAGCLWGDSNNCNSCSANVYENQMTRLLMIDTTDTASGQQPSYRARITVEPNTTVKLLASWFDLGTFGQGFLGNQGLQVVSGVSYETHGIDVDNQLNVYIALKGKNNAIVDYHFNPSVGSDPSLNYQGGSYSFNVLDGWQPDMSDPTNYYNMRTLGSWGTYMTTDVTLPDSVIGFPDMVKLSMLAGVSCEGCSMQGAVTPGVCTSQVNKFTSNQSQNLNQSLQNTGISPGTSVVKVNATTPPVYRQNSITTNITAFLRLNYTFDIYELPGGCGKPGLGTLLLPEVKKQLNITSYSNNLEALVEGGGDHFELTTPNYPEKPSNIPNTLPYLAYSYLTNRLFYKHFAMMNNMTNDTGNLNIMGPLPNDFWQGYPGGNSPLDYISGAWCIVFPNACNNPSLEEWILNASYRKSFQTFGNEYYGYYFITTVPTVDEHNQQTPLYGVEGSWDAASNTLKGEPDANGFINPDIYSHPPGSIPLNNTLNWSYPVKFNFTPISLASNPLPFTPQDRVPSGTDYTYSAITNVSLLQLTILCKNSGGGMVTYTATITNTTWTPLGDCLDIYGISISGASDNASLFITPVGLPLTDGICFDVLGDMGPVINSIVCSSTRAWFKQQISPNTVVAYTSDEPYIPTPTRFPLIGEPDAQYPSSLKVIPVKMSGPTLMTIQGQNASWTEPVVGQLTSEFGTISATANLGGAQISNPLPFNLTAPFNVTAQQPLYFKSDSDVDFLMAGEDAAPWSTPIIYKSTNGWILVAGAGTTFGGSVTDIKYVSCHNSQGCLFQFANDSAGANILGQIFVAPGFTAFHGSIDGVVKDPQYTYSIPKGNPEIELVPDDPTNRNFMNIIAVNGRGYLGDSFNLYTDPDVMVSIDNLTAGNCTPCTMASQCPTGINCNAGVCKTPTCDSAKHPSGLPCVPSFICPRLDMSTVNSTLMIASSQDHDANNNTIITIVGTQDDPDHTLVVDSMTLKSYTSSGGTNFLDFGTNNYVYSGIYIIKVENAIKGETLYFRAKKGYTDIGSLNIPTENYTTKSVIGSLQPTPRRLRIISDSNDTTTPITYRIRGTSGDDTIVDESGSVIPTAQCSLKGASVVQPDTMLNQCQFQFNTISNPQTTNAPFGVTITAAPPAWAAPPDKLVYPTVTTHDQTQLCDGSLGAELADGKNGNGACFETYSPGAGTWITNLSYTSSMAEYGPSGLCSYGTNVADVLTIDGNGACIDTQGASLILKLASPLNASALNITVKTAYICAQGSCPSVNVGFSTNPGCFSSSSNNNQTTNTSVDWNAFNYKSFSFTPPAIEGGSWSNDIVPLGADYTNVYCIGINTTDRSWCCGPACVCGAFCHQNYLIDSIGVIGNNTWVPPPPPPPPSFEAIQFDQPYNITGFDVVAKNEDPTVGSSINLLWSDNPNCLAGPMSSITNPANWKGSQLIPLTATGSYQENIVAGLPEMQNVWCIGFNSTDQVGTRWLFDAIGVYQHINSVPPVYNCSKFSGNATISDLSGRMCPSMVGPFAGGVWTGSVMIPTSYTNDQLTVSNPSAIPGVSNFFDVQYSPGASMGYIDTVKAFTNVLSIEINRSANEHFNVTTVPYYLDCPLGVFCNTQPEQIGIINVIPNDFSVGFYQNASGTYLYSQQDSVNLNIPDNNSLGMHDFQFRFFDRFNNTFIIPYTIWLRQPTSIVLSVTTDAVSGNLYLTNVSINAQLLYEPYTQPQVQPSIPIGEGYELDVYVQNSSDTPYDYTTCDPTNLAVCPVPMSISNCSCPDYIDDPNQVANPGGCIPNSPPVGPCKQYGYLENASSGMAFFTDANGRINASFQIYGFGRRLLFVVFNGTRDYAPSIAIQPFYAGGISIAMGEFSVLEPALLLASALILVVIKRKFNKQKNR